MGDFMNNIVYTTEVNRYAFFEKRSPSAFTRVCIDGHITGSNKCVGYCQYKEHSGFLTTELLVQHDCIKKGCDYFIAKPKYKDTTKNHDDMSLTILSHAQKAFSHIIAPILQRAFPALPGLSFRCRISRSPAR